MTHLSIPLTSFVASLTSTFCVSDLIQHAVVVCSLWLALRAMRQRDTSSSKDTSSRSDAAK